MNASIQKERAFFCSISSSFFITFLSSEVTSNNKSDTIPLMHEAFEAIGQPRNYELSSEEGQDKESRRDEKSMGEGGSPTLWDKGQGQEEQKPEDSEEWVGSRAAHRDSGLP